jgi:hypothetical protein
MSTAPVVDPFQYSPVQRFFYQVVLHIFLKMKFLFFTFSTEDCPADTSLHGLKLLCTKDGSDNIGQLKETQVMNALYFMGQQWIGLRKENYYAEV